MSAPMSSSSVFSSMPAGVEEQMTAGAFRTLCDHLRVRSDSVQNMDLMTIGGFCRNCLAKWMVLEARKLSQRLQSDKIFAASLLDNEEDVQSTIIGALNSLGYDEAAKEVYGITYPEWKKRHQKKATEDQLRLYKESSHLHATHDADVLKKVEGGVENDTQENAIPERVMTLLQSGAFQSLCEHLRVRSDEVQNMDLMTISGFCRNCLAKWLVVEARTIANKIGSDNVASAYFHQQQKHTINTLNAFGYDEAAQYVYGCTYPEWKKRHQKKATNEQLERYNASKHLHAKHDKDLLATRSQNVGASPGQSIHSVVNTSEQVCMKGTAQSNSLLSDVCCQDVDAIAAPAPAVVQSTTKNIPEQSMIKPPKGVFSLKIGVLTVSDRASANAYESGDLSGPAVEKAVTNHIDQVNSSFQDQSIRIARLDKLIVPDDIPAIKEALLRWSNKAAEGGSYDLVFTTGGTGFAQRDVTPEATLSILDRECQGLMSWASMELTAKQPLATLSRAAAGTCGNTFIINLPGNPKGAAEVVELLFPLLLHALKDLQAVSD